MKIVKWIVLLITAGGLLLFFACSEDPETPGFDFINQNLQGQIDGTNWELQTGTAEISASDPGRLSIEMVDEDITDPCDQFFFDQEQIFFGNPSSGNGYTAGRHI